MGFIAPNKDRATPVGFVAPAGDLPLGVGGGDEFAPEPKATGFLDKAKAFGADVLDRGPIAVIRQRVLANPETSSKFYTPLLKVLGATGAGALSAAPSAATMGPAAPVGIAAAGAAGYAAGGGLARRLDELQGLATPPSGLAEGAAQTASDITEGGKGELLGPIAAKGVSAVAEPLGNVASTAARRALGFTKQHMSSTKSPFEAMRKTAAVERASKEMLDKDVIPALGNPSEMQTRALSVLKSARDGMASVVDKAKGAAIDAQKAAGRLIDDLSPKYPDEQKIAESILEDMTVASKDGPIALRDAIDLKSRWGRLGFDVKTVGTTAATMYRKAERFLDRVISEEVKRAGGDELLGQWASAKATFANATTALRGITNQVASEMGNNVASLPSLVLAGGELAGGSPMRAAATLGISQAVLRRGAATTANVLKGASRAAKGATVERGRGLAAILQAYRNRNRK